MPKTGKSSINGCYYSISPWQTAGDKSSHHKSSSYTVIDEDVIFNEREDDESQALLSFKSGPMAGGPSATMTVDTFSRQPLRAIDEPPSNTRLDSNKSNKVWKNDINSAFHAPFDAQGGRIEGTATLALVGQNWIVGSLCECVDGKDRSFPIYGKVIKSFRECTRDEDWSLVRLDIMVKMPCIQKNFRTFAEKSGADAISLKAPIDWHGDEFDEFMNKMNEESIFDRHTTIHFSFECERLLTDAAADGEVSKHFPWLAGFGAILNQGSALLEWKSSLDVP